MYQQASLIFRALLASDKPVSRTFVAESTVRIIRFIKFWRLNSFLSVHLQYKRSYKSNTVSIIILIRNQGVTFECENRVQESYQQSKDLILRGWLMQCESFLNWRFLINEEQEKLHFTINREKMFQLKIDLKLVFC